jgi:GTP cyclohydrolase I
MGGIKVVVDESKVKEAVKLLLEGIGEDPEREGLKDTPDRIARMYTELMAGYEDKPSNHLSRTFQAENNEMVLEKDIVFYSMCEHHMMPFFGKAHIAYIPNGKVVGLSKLARCVETYARRLQIQEKMTAQIADAIMEELTPQGVMIVVEAEHLCMTARGVKKPGSKTTTVVTRGVFTDNEKLQTLFFRLLNERVEGLPDENR